jgi:prevent-host-death family protein
MQTITVREANLHFSRYMAAVDLGEELIVTKRGREIARIVPGKDAAAVQRKPTIEEHRARLAQLLSQLPLSHVGGPFNRDDFYD